MRYVGTSQPGRLAFSPFVTTRSESVTKRALSLLRHFVTRPGRFGVFPPTGPTERVTSRRVTPRSIGSSSPVRLDPWIEYSTTTMTRFLRRKGAADYFGSLAAEITRAVANQYQLHRVHPLRGSPIRPQGSLYLPQGVRSGKTGGPRRVSPCARRVVCTTPGSPTRTGYLRSPGC